MVVWAVERKICGRAAGPEIHAHFLLAFCVSGMRFFFRECGTSKTAGCTENTRKTCKLKAFKRLCHVNTMDRPETVREYSASGAGSVPLRIFFWLCQKLRCFASRPSDDGKMLVVEPDEVGSVYG